RSECHCRGPECCGHSYSAGYCLCLGLKSIAEAPRLPKGACPIEAAESGSKSRQCRGASLRPSHRGATSDPTDFAEINDLTQLTRIVRKLAFGLLLLLLSIQSAAAIPMLLVDARTLQVLYAQDAGHPW